ncbi:thermophilic metalloprotease [bacterium BMS3Bbin08]|nr:thermophilic metalloprotease [bacterium BMS3Bbin08]
MKKNNIPLKPINNIYKVNLKVRKNEKVLVFTDNFDKKLQDIAKLIAEKGRSHTTKMCYMEIRTTSSHGAEPPESLWQAAYGERAVRAIKLKKLFTPLLGKKINDKQLKKIEGIIGRFKKDSVRAVIALSYHSTTHTRFRSLLTGICGTRYASMPLFDPSMLSGAMTVNWRKMEKKTKKIAQRVNKSEKLEIKTPNGTFIMFSKKGRKAKTDTGIITRPGSSSNLPAGEVYFAPIEGTANGRLVLDWAPTRKLKRPVTLHVKKGKVTKVEGKERFVNYLKAKLAEREENANIAELGIGTNDKASKPDNILESEKILGTIHIALGDNSSFGGKISTPFHQDFVFFRPTVTLIHKDNKKELLLKNGRLCKAGSVKTV